MRPSSIQLCGAGTTDNAACLRALPGFAGDVILYKHRGELDVHHWNGHISYVPPLRINCEE